ncbi:MAG TPA: response regulator transcription factor [Rhizomicrobium sp.]|jgi:DNA-binding NarL/FixJ family response regulator|nr:response regulator transcription factor [Rhizomicrobium sp.]
MPEAARANLPGEIVRVHLSVQDSARASELARLLGDLGFWIVGSSDADIVLSDADAHAVRIVAATGSGAKGVLPAGASPRQIDAALRAVAAGLNVQAPPGERFSAIDEHEATSPLTPRELEILMALSDGLSNKAIARRFTISQHTVKFHAESIFRKLGATTRAEAVAKGLRQGLVHL